MTEPRPQRRRRPRPGTVKALSSVLWAAITELDRALTETARADRVDTGELCRLSHALSQSASTYLKATELGSLEARVLALEAAAAAGP